MKHVYHFHESLVATNGIKLVIDWCYAQGGERKVDWNIQSKFHSGGAGNPIKVEVGLQIEDDETALAFELAFNVKEIRVGEERLLKYVTRS